MEKANQASETCSRPNYRRTHLLEAAVLDYLGQFVDERTVRRHLTAVSKKASNRGAAELKRVEKRLVELEGALQKTLDAYEKGLIDDRDLKDRNDARRAQRDALETRHETMRVEVQAEANTDAATAAIPEKLATFREGFEALPVPKAKAMLQEILKAVHVTKEGIEIEFRT